MTHNDIVLTLQTNYPGAHWVLNGDTYEGFIWFDDPATKPSAQDLGF